MTAPAKKSRAENSCADGHVPCASAASPGCQGRIIHGLADDCIRDSSSRMPGRRKSGPAFWMLMRHRQPRQDGISARRPKSPVRRVSPPALRPAPYRKQPPTCAWAAQARTHSLNRALATGNRRLVLEPSDRHHPALLADESCAASLATPDAGVIGHPKPTAFAQSLRPSSRSPLGLPSRRLPPVSYINGLLPPFANAALSSSCKPLSRTKSQPRFLAASGLLPASHNSSHHLPQRYPRERHHADLRQDP